MSRCRGGDQQERPRNLCHHDLGNSRERAPCARLQRMADRGLDDASVERRARHARIPMSLRRSISCIHHSSACKEPCSRALVCALIVRKIHVELRREAMQPVSMIDSSHLICWHAHILYSMCRESNSDASNTDTVKCGSGRSRGNASRHHCRCHSSPRNPQLVGGSFTRSRIKGSARCHWLQARSAWAASHATRAHQEALEH